MPDQSGHAAHLNSPEDWDQWNTQFVSKAVAASLWKSIDPNNPVPMPIERPVPPSMNDYPVKAGTPAGFATAASLTSDGRASFSLDWNVYTHLLRRYEKEADSFKHLKDFVSQSVAPHIYRACCNPTESIRSWYSKLKDHTSLGQDELKLRARGQYRLATKPLTGIPSKTEEWIQEWEKAFATAQSKGLPETQEASIWARDFFQAVAKPFPEWTRTAERIFRAEIFNNQLTYRELIRDFRLELETYPVAEGLPPKAMRGGFGTQFAEQKKKRNREATKCLQLGQPAPTARPRKPCSGGYDRIQTRDLEFSTEPAALNFLRTPWPGLAGPVALNPLRTPWPGLELPTVMPDEPGSGLVHSRPGGTCRQPLSPTWVRTWV